MEFDQNTENDVMDAIDLRRLFYLLSRNIWLILLGLVVGGGAAFAFSRYQTPIYEAKTQVMVTRSSSEGPVADLTQALNSQQISQTYVELLSQDWVLVAVAERVGGEIGEKQIKVAAATNTQIIGITVEDPDPVRAAAIADTLVQVLIEQNESIQAGRYTDAEESLNQQIHQMETQIAQAQAELDQANAAALAAQLDKLEGNVNTTRAEVEKLQAEIADLEGQKTPDEESLLAARQDLRNQQSLLSGYEQAYSSLLISEKFQADTPEIARLEKNLALYQQIYLSLLNNRETVRLERMQNMPNVVQLNPAIPSTAPIRPRTLLNTLLGGMAGLILAVAIVFLRDMLDSTIKTPEDVERLLGLPVLGFVAEMKYKKDSPQEVYITRQPRSPVSEAFRSLRTNIEFSSVQKPIHSILVTSPGPAEGKTTVAVNLAAIFSQIKKRVVLLDADLRRPHVHHLLGLSNREGLSSLFLNADQTSNVGRTREDLPNLVIITSGSLPPNPAELLGSEKMNHVLHEMTRNVDLVVIDTPPSLVADALILAAKVDAVLFVIQPGVTRIETARASVKSFNRLGARVVGVVMNRIPRNRSHYYGGYQYYSPYNDSKGYFSGNGGKPAEKLSEIPNGRPSGGTAEKPAVSAAVKSAAASQPITVPPPASNDTLNRMFEQLKGLHPGTKKNDTQK